MKPSDKPSDFGDTNSFGSSFHPRFCSHFRLLTENVTVNEKIFNMKDMKNSLFQLFAYGIFAKEVYFHKTFSLVNSGKKQITCHKPKFILVQIDKQQCVIQC